MLELYLIRHKECKANLETEIITGRANDSPPTEIGNEQGLLLAERLAREGIIFKKMYSSPAKRAIKTAEPVAIATGYSDKIIILDELSEKSQGEWEGKIRAKIHTPELIETMNSNRTRSLNFAAPQGESYRDVEERFKRAVYQKILPENDNEGIIGIFSHRLAILSFLRSIFDFNPLTLHKISLGYTNITRLTYQPQKMINNEWTLRTLNDTAHLYLAEFSSR